MTYAAWELARKPEMQHKLREELKTISDIVSYPSGKQLESLPLFNGFLKEVLRLWPTRACYPNRQELQLTSN